MLLFVVLAACDVMARTNVRVIVEVDVPGYTARWKASGELAGLKQELFVDVQQLLQQDFAFLEWDGDPKATLLLTVQEDPNSPRAPGLRPLVLVATLDGVLHGTPIRICDADKVVKGLPRNDLAKAARGLVTLVGEQLKNARDKEAWANAFVAKVLSAVPVADDIEAYGSGAVLITVPHADLRATPMSRLEARFDGAPPESVERRVGLELAPWAARAGRTECNIVKDLVSFRSVDERTRYIENRKLPVTVGMTFYDRLDGPRRSHDTSEVRQ